MIFKAFKKNSSRDNAPLICLPYLSEREETDGGTERSSGRLHQLPPALASSSYRSFGDGVDRIHDISATDSSGRNPPLSDRSIRFADDRSTTGASGISARSSARGSGGRYSGIQDFRNWSGGGGGAGSYGEISLVGRLSGGGRGGGSGRAAKRYTPRSAPPPIIPEEGEDSIYRYEDREIALVAPEDYEDDIFSRLSDGRLSLRLAQRPLPPPSAAAELVAVDIQLVNEDSPTGKPNPSSQPLVFSNIYSKSYISFALFFRWNWWHFQEEAV